MMKSYPAEKSTGPEKAEPATEIEYLEESNDILTEIEKHLRSIKNMLTFFVILAIIGLIISLFT